MKTLLFSALFGSCALFSTEAEAFKVQVLPSVTFRSSQHTCQPCPAMVISRPMTEVYHYYDPYTGREYIYRCPGPVCQRVVYPYHPYPATVRTQGTDFQLQFRIR